MPFAQYVCGRCLRSLAVVFQKECMHSRSLVLLDVVSFSHARHVKTFANTKGQSCRSSGDAELMSWPWDVVAAGCWGNQAIHQRYVTFFFFEGQHVWPFTLRTRVLLATCETKTQLSHFIHQLTCRGLQVAPHHQHHKHRVSSHRTITISTHGPSP